MDKQMKYGALFSTSIPESERERALEVIRTFENGLSFKIHQDKNGWTGQCNEISGIIAGDTNPNPTDDEIKSGIREAIAAAFNLEEEEKQPEPTSTFEYSYA